jgi:hypothetical protein
VAPRLPKALWSPHGPLPVLRSKTLLEDEGAFGQVMWRPREITLDATSCPATQAQTLFHEAVHVALWDSGVHNSLTDEQEEAVCDAVGNYLAAMMHAGCLTIRAPK